LSREQLPQYIPAAPAVIDRILTEPFVSFVSFVSFVRPMHA